MMVVFLWMNQLVLLPVIPHCVGLSQVVHSLLVLGQEVRFQELDGLPDVVQLSLWEVLVAPSEAYLD